MEWITGNDFRRMIVGAHRTFMREHEYINNLNVFPVPDGDTGTNMLMTLGAVARAVSEAPEEGIGSLSRRAADSAIMGARGNSGVILSQIFRGIARGLAGKERATSDELGKAFQYGVLYAYRSVSKPVEGTILTVAKGIAKGARRAVREHVPFADILSEAISAGEAELARTPELLPILKSAGVVDAGGKGLTVFLTGCLAGLSGEMTSPETDWDRHLTVSGAPLMAGESAADLTHPYCTEFLVKGYRLSVADARKLLASQGDSQVVAEGGEFLKVHLHTAHPGAVLEMALGWGTLHNIKIDNMSDQHRQTIVVPEPTGRPRVPLGVISVAAGAGLAEMMQQLGAEHIVMGGQTMNPPVEEFVATVHQGNADRYILLPNNKNIILAAAQVKKLLGERIEVIPSGNVPQGLAALVAFDPALGMEENVANMKARITDIKGGAVTVAVRDSIVEDKTVAAGRYIGVVDNRVLVDGEEVSDALLGLIGKLADDDTEIISLYYGEGLHEEEARALATLVSEAWPAAEVELYPGGQPHYHFIVSVE